MAEKIKSRADLFKDDDFWIDKPPMCVTIYDAHDEPIFTCPHCKAQMNDDETGIIGAEPNCRFCCKCNREFEI